MIDIIAVRMSPSDENRHERIAEVKWEREGGLRGVWPIADAVDFVETFPKVVWVPDKRGGRVEVGVVRPPRAHAHLRTFADGQPTNNLLELPRF